MKKARIIIAILLVLVVIPASIAFAASEESESCRFVPSAPTLTATGSTASCKAQIRALGSSIDATLELYQGSTLINSWHKTGTSYVSFNETEPFTSGLSYTLTLSGTVDGVAFTPVSVTKTLW